MKKKRLLTGDRPTGSSYVIGQYIGTIKSRIELQDGHECFIFSADYHSLTTNISKTFEIRKNAFSLVREQISFGVDPNKVVFYRQSRISETFRLHVLLSMIINMPELQRQPALKEKIAQGCMMSYGLVGYPVLMASDILIMASNVVPVAKDQEAHVEIAQLLGRKFNSIFGKVLTIPDKLINPVLIGLDGKGKSGKSTGGIFIKDSTKEVKRKVMSMYTDPNRIKATDPGKVEGNPVFIYHDCFNENLDEVEDLKKRYREGKVGDVEVKEKLFNAIEEFLSPVREKKQKLEKLGDEYIVDLFEKGEKRAIKVASDTIERLNKVIGF